MMDGSTAMEGCIVMIRKIK